MPLIPDDEILGCGGSIHHFQQLGHNVKTLIISQGRDWPFDQRMDDVPLVRWIHLIETEIQSFHPQIIFSHYGDDLNRDHQIIAEATQVAARPQSGVVALYAYDTNSASYCRNFDPDFYVPLDTSDVDFKLAQMEQLYGAELRDFPHPRSLEGIKNYLAYRGMQILQPNAEAFKTIRRIYGTNGL